MAIKIEQPIVSASVKDDETPVEEEQTEVERELMHEGLQRPESLMGTTYKVKTPVDDASLYITINDIVLDAGTKHEHRRPFEIFINSKNMDKFQWIVGLTRIISAVFRKGGDVAFLVEELRSVFDPNGGYFKKGGVYMPSMVAEIGHVLEMHLTMIGLMEKPEMDEHQKALVEEKRKQFEAHSDTAPAVEGESGSEDFPDGAQLCPKCNTKALVLMDGCMTCLNCGDSKCG